MKKSTLLPSLIWASLFLPTLALSQPVLSPTGAPILLSGGEGEQNPDLDTTSKTKLVRLTNGGASDGRLLTVFADGWGSSAFPDGHRVYDVKADIERPARDIFARYSDDDGQTWSDTVNLSQTAALTSIATLWQGEDSAIAPFYGDSDKPNIFNSGTMVVVSWVDKYCDPDQQGSVSYIERDFREIPFSCVYSVRSIDGGATWQPAQRLTSGVRDAKQDVNRGSSKAWVITWQEDPAGLLLGEAEGPGHGASGAIVSHGTDIWYSSVSTAFPEGGKLSDSPFGKGMPFSPPSRITNNWTKMEDKRNDGDPIQSGTEGASRANLALIGGTVVVAYEETKGTEGIDEGKYIRYHSFPFNQPPASVANACLSELNGSPQDCQDDNLPPNAQLPQRMGCILSAPEQNGRRVRFLPQAKPGPSGTKLFIFWKQGEYDQGGPSDIVGRLATDFADLSSFHPALNVAPADAVGGCLIRGEDDATEPLLQGAFANAPAMNLSHETPLGGDLAAHSDDNPIEDARAHRGYIRGDTLILGYSYTPDLVLARATDLEHYNFWIRRSLDGGHSWEAARDITSELILAYVNQHPDYTAMAQVDVKEPRIVKAPGSSPVACPTGDPDDPSTTDPSLCSNPEGFIVAGGLVENTYEHLGAGRELELFVTRSLDAGATYETPLIFTAADSEDYESQLRVSPDLSQTYVVWNSATEAQGVNGYFITLAPQEPAPEPRRTTSSGTLGMLALLMLGLVLAIIRFNSTKR
ncbi:glycoside hydrolase [Ferrimonas balearica]|uniref:sialidase family protein n=1 Tax=Ferrimonas balearica TaxID=44012 RepID=UPI001C9429E2|nr:sialidase family protein [Ferrimonas balearica]MBY6108510.1 glycoside hydrolase [Ferrimonas balearica]